MVVERLDKSAPQGYLEAIVEPADKRDTSWWNKLISGFQRVAGTKGQAIEDLKKARKAASEGGVGKLERPKKLNQLSDSEIERNIADARLKQAQANREKAEEEKVRLTMKMAALEATADANLKDAQAEKLRAETRKIEEETKVAISEAWLRTFERLKEHGFDVTPFIDNACGTLIIKDISGEKKRAEILALPDEIVSKQSKTP